MRLTPAIAVQADLSRPDHQQMTVTLEVQENNHRARQVYGAAGFSQAIYVPEAGGSLYLSKPL